MSEFRKTFLTHRLLTDFEKQYETQKYTQKQLQLIEQAAHTAEINGENSVFVRKSLIEENGIDPNVLKGNGNMLETTKFKEALDEWKRKEFLRIITEVSNLELFPLAEPEQEIAEEVIKAEETESEEMTEQEELSLYEEIEQEEEQTKERSKDISRSISSRVL